MFAGVPVTPIVSDGSISCGFLLGDLEVTPQDARTGKGNVTSILVPSYSRASNLMNRCTHGLEEELKKKTGNMNTDVCRRSCHHVDGRGT
jgi:hypothetical protein